jgi:FAD/FMN-containing dehydrogenase/Fe-S oxidoreductase
MSLHPDFAAELRKHFTGDIRLDAGSRVLYSTDASIYQIEPLGVVLPRTQDDLHCAVELAAKYKVPILPRGSGSSLAGQAVGEALILDCSRWLDQIVEINVDAKTATVEPGVVLSTLNRAAAKYGLQFGPDPASAERATMGGIIGNNATGAHSILYGMTADHLLSADVILSDGSLETLDNLSFDNRNLNPESRLSNIVLAAREIGEKYTEAIQQHYPKSWRNSAGYRLNYLLPWSPSRPPQWMGENYPPGQNGKINLAALLAGSEGTLAVIRRATIQLVPKPKYTILGILSYHSNAEACDAVPGLLEHHPSAIELIPQMILRLARGIPAYARQMGWVSGDPAAVLVVEFSGDRPEVLKEAVRHLRDDVVVAESSEEQARVWNIRKVGLGILDSRQQPARSTTFIEDCAIPVERLGDFVRAMEKILSDHRTEGGMYAHASAGCLHIRPILNLKTSAGVRALRGIAEQTLALTLRLGGSMASEHGDGIARGEWLKQTYGEELIAAMRALKNAADPDGLLNPGKLFDAPPMDSHLRYGPNYQTHVWKTPLHFAHTDGLAGAIEQCNGQGVCRKDTGVMCPSFQATREEQNSTRGRANLLRALIASPNIEDRISKSDRPYLKLEAPVFSALDLCLACKGCKAECPSGVDMAKLKFAFLDEYYRLHRRPLRDYVFGYFHVTAKLLSAIAPIANFVSGVPFVRRVFARIIGIAPERPFPKFSTRRAKIKTTQISGPSVLFLPDPYSHYVEPQVEQAAFDLLSELGFNVKVLPAMGAGAALFSKGFLQAARQHAISVLGAINHFDPNGVLPVVGIEPPEIYMLKNDYADLLPEHAEELSRRKSRVWLLDEFLIRSERISNLEINAPLQRIKFHPHCHQSAEGPSDDGLPTGPKASVELLRACGFDVEQTNAGCCGMAGTFGYEAEHYDLSQKIGALKLFPQINERGDAVVASTGTACRMQIVQGTGVAAEHPIAIVERAIREGKLSVTSFRR